MVSGTITLMPVEEHYLVKRWKPFGNVFRHFPLLSVGFNCALGADAVKNLFARIGQNCRCSHFPAILMQVYLMNLANMNETPGQMSRIIKSYFDEGLVNIIGGLLWHSTGTYQSHSRVCPKVETTQNIWTEKNFNAIKWIGAFIHYS